MDTNTEQKRTVRLAWLCPYCGKEKPSGYEPSVWGCCGEAGHAVAMPMCPKCGSEMFHRQHRFSTERGPNLPDADWDECEVCGFQTDPE